MTRQDQTYDDRYGQYDELPPRNNQNRQQQQQGKQHNGGNKNQNRDAPNFRPPSPVRATDKDDLYQMIFRFSPVGMDESFLIPSTTYWIQNRGIVDGRSGIRRSKTKGFALYDSDGSLFLIHQNDPEYGYFNDRVEEWNSVWNGLVELANETPSQRRSNRRAAAGQRGSRAMQTVSNAPLKWYIKWGMIAAIILAILTFIATRS